MKQPGLFIQSCSRWSGEGSLWHPLCLSACLYRVAHGGLVKAHGGLVKAHYGTLFVFLLFYLLRPGLGIWLKLAWNLQSFRLIILSVYRHTTTNPNLKVLSEFPGLGFVILRKNSSHLEFAMTNPLQHAVFFWLAVFKMNNHQLLQRLKESG